MAFIVPITEKPVAEKVRGDAYVLGVQDDGSGQQALYRMPLSVVANNGANDLVTVADLIDRHGTTTAFRIFAQMYADSDDLTRIADRFFRAAATTVTDTYTSVFYRFSTSTSSYGEKRGANASLVAAPSTDTDAARDDYADLPLFAPFDVNYKIDPDTLEPIILAIKGVYGNFESAPIDSLVGVMQMTGWVRRTMTETTKTVDYGAASPDGFEPLPEAMCCRDNTVRSFVVHAKYVAGYNANGRLSSISGVPIASYGPTVSSDTGCSHDGQIDKWRAWGEQYGGASLCDCAFYQLMLEIKYAVLGNAPVMQGCRSYDHSYPAAISETRVRRIVLSSAGELLVGSCVSLGTTSDRTKSTTYSVCWAAKITSIEDVIVNGTTYKAVNLETSAPFNTAAGTTIIVTQPWNTGSTDSVMGNDGSPISNESGKAPFKIQGIELALGAFEVIADVTTYEDATHGYSVFINRKAANVKAGGSGTKPQQVGSIQKERTAGYKFIAELNWGANSQEAYMLGQEFTTGSAEGYCAAVYRDATSVVGWKAWRTQGFLSSGSYAGLSFVSLYAELAAPGWYHACRAGGSGANRGVYTIE